MHLNVRLRMLYALSSVVLAELACEHSVRAASSGATPLMPMPPVSPAALAAIVAASPREKALATLKAITPGVIQRRFDQERRWEHESNLKAYEEAGSHDQSGTPSSAGHINARTAYSLWARTSS